MQNYVALVLLILLVNSLPAFTPPTWTLLVFFQINYELNPFALVLLGVVSATLGRGFLAWYVRKYSHLAPKRFTKNMEYAGEYFQQGTGKKYTILGLFLVSPISSAQLFVAAGFMKTIALRPLLGAFALGRTVSYTTYVTGTSFIAASNVGEIVIQELKSPWAIATQIGMILALVGIGNLDWSKRVRKSMRDQSPN